MSLVNSILNKDVQKIAKMSEIVGSDFENSSEEAMSTLNPSKPTYFLTVFLSCWFE